jgi:hypothetical protein
MNTQIKTASLIGTGLFAAAFITASVSIPAQALTMAECSAKYKQAKTDGSLNGRTWNVFRKDECGADTAAAPAPAPAPAATKPVATKPAPAPTPPPAASGPAVLPNGVDAKFSSQKPYLQRLHTCSEQWQANKASGGNGGLKWPQFWSECDKRLKGA